MPPIIVSIYHKPHEGKFLFGLYARKGVLVPEPESDNLIMEHEFYDITATVEIADPFEWPVPVESDANLGNKLQWYLEDYPYEKDFTSERMGGHVIEALRGWGKEAFQALFQSEDAIDLFNYIYSQGPSDSQWVEICSDNSYILSWPWEALTDAHERMIGHRIAIERKFCPPGLETIPEKQVIYRD